MDANRLARPRGLHDHRLRGEVERHAQDVRVLDVEQAVLVQLVGLPPQGAPDHLLAEELGAERTHAQDVGDRVRVPALGQHRHRDDAADLLPEFSGLADCVHDLAQQILIGNLLHRRGAGTLRPFALELVDLGAGIVPEVVMQGVARFELLAVDQERARARQAIAVLVVIAEQLQPSRDVAGFLAFLLPLETGDEVIDQLRGCGVVADDNEHRRRADPLLFPKLEGLLVVTVEGKQRRLQLRWQAQRIEHATLAPPLLRHPPADMVPEVAVDRHLAGRQIVGDRYARQLDDAALDRVHEREVADRPGKEGTLGIA
jgi:hypothetical protein